jgi:lipid A oxidase
MLSTRSLVVLAVLALLTTPRHAQAEWVLGAYLGASWTASTSLRLDQPGAGVHLAWADVPFDSKSFESPFYYGYRAGWFPTRASRFGVSGELIHLKVFAQSAVLSPAVQRFSISHGLNLVLGNLIWRQPPSISRRVGLSARAGVGFAVPHGESEVFGATQEQYEVSSVAVQGAVGPNVRLTDHLNAVAEYKLTTASPSVSVSGGTIKGRYTSQHLAAGLEVWW